VCRVGPHIVTNYHCIAALAADRTNTQVNIPLLLHGKEISDKLIMLNATPGIFLKHTAL